MTETAQSKNRKIRDTEFLRTHILSHGHLILNDRDDDRWQAAQRRGEAPMYTLKD